MDDYRSTLQALEKRQINIELQFKTMNASIDELLELFKAGKTTVRFIANIGRLVKWFGVIAASLASIWLLVTSLKNGMVPPNFGGH